MTGIINELVVNVCLCVQWSLCSLWLPCQCSRVSSAVSSVWWNTIVVVLQITSHVTRQLTCSQGHQLVS